VQLDFDLFEVIFMEVLRPLLQGLPHDAIVERVTVGLFWTAVVVNLAGERRCGLAATLANEEFEHARFPAVRQAGVLDGCTVDELLAGLFSNSYTEVGIGLATMNALLPRVKNSTEVAAEEYIAQHGTTSRVALIGHFPFVDRLREKVQQLWVLELNPREGDLPAEMAPHVVPQADILAITATTLINGTFEGLMRLRRPGAKVLLLGPSTPLSPLLFAEGVDVLSGAVVEDVDRGVRLVQQGATFRQIRQQGVRLVTIEAKNFRS
jgi:uncharacterized protein (DUF4213/DUF364 family)